MADSLTAPTRNSAELPEAIASLHLQSNETSRHVLPASIAEWRALKTGNSISELTSGWAIWEHLRGFFSSSGYTLYRQRNYDLVPEQALQPLVPDAFGVYGHRQFMAETDFLPTNAVYPAQTRDNLDVIIKLIAAGPEPNTQELDILRFLSSDQQKADPENHALPIVEILQYEHFTFVVLPRWGDSVDRTFRHSEHALEFCIQVSEGLSFLHRNRIAHLDVSHENILINYLGIYQLLPEYRGVNFRTLFPVRYAIIDFGLSRRYPLDADMASCISEEYKGRPHKAPELRLEKPYNPFAADVYQAGVIFYSWFRKMERGIPEFVTVIREMTKENPGDRISMAEAHRRLVEMKERVFPNGIDNCDNAAVHFGISEFNDFIVPFPEGAEDQDAGPHSSEGTS